MSVELKTENLVKGPTNGLLNDEFFDAEDGGELNFIKSITRCRAIYEYKFRCFRYRSIIASRGSISRHIWVGLLVVVSWIDFRLSG